MKCSEGKLGLIKCCDDVNDFDYAQSLKGKFILLTFADE